MCFDKKREEAKLHEIKELTAKKVKNYLKMKFEKMTNDQSADRDIKVQFEVSVEELDP